MTVPTQTPRSEQLIATIDARELHGIRSGSCARCFRDWSKRLSWAGTSGGC